MKDLIYNNLIYLSRRNLIYYIFQIKKLLIIFICLIAFTSCQEKVTTQPIIPIVIEDIPHISEKFQRITSDFSLVPLETNDESLIQYIKKIVIYDNKIYVLDDQRPLFAVFSSKGKFIQSIGNRGNGPGEFHYPTDFIIDTLHKQIELYDGLRDRILIYDLVGSFLKSIRVPVRGDYFIKFTNEDYMIYTNMRNEKKMPFKLVRIDKSGKLLSKELAYTTKTNQTLYSPFVQLDIDRYILSEQNCDTIFQVSQKEITPWVHLNMGKEGMPYEYRLDLNKSNNNSQKYSIKAGSPMIFGSHLIIEYEKKWNPKYLFFDLATNKAYYYKVSNTYDLAFGTPKFSSNNKLIGIIHPSAINLHKTNPQYMLQYRVGEKLELIENLRKNMNEVDNPCIVIWTLNSTVL